MNGFCADMSVVGRLRTDAENRAHWAAWCICSSPLILSYDLTDEDVMNRTWPIISNKMALSISQTFAGSSFEVDDSQGLPHAPFHPGGLVKSWSPTAEGTPDAPSGAVQYLLVTTGVNRNFGWHMPAPNASTQLRQDFPSGLCVDARDASGRGSDGGDYGVMMQTCNASSPTQKMIVLPVNSSRPDWVNLKSLSTGHCLTLEDMNGPAVIWTDCGSSENVVFTLGGDPGGGTICTAGTALALNEQGPAVRCLSASMSSDPSGASGVPTGIGMQMWAKPQANGSIAVLVLNNRNPLAAKVAVDIDLSEVTQTWRGHGYRATEVWSGQSYRGAWTSLDQPEKPGWIDPSGALSMVFRVPAFGGHDSSFWLFEPDERTASLKSDDFSTVEDPNCDNLDVDWAGNYRDGTQAEFVLFRKESVLVKSDDESGTTVPPHIKIMTAYGYDAPVQAGWSTFGKSFNLSALVEGHRTHGLPGMWRIDCIGCQNVAKKWPGFASGVVCEVKLRNGTKFKRMCSKAAGDSTNWDEQTRLLLAMAGPGLISGALVGIFLGDEITGHGPGGRADITEMFADFEAWVDLVRGLLDEIAPARLAAGNAPPHLYYTEADVVALWPHIPHNLTLFSMDDYHPAWMYPSRHACAKGGYPRPVGCENETAGLWVYPRYVSPPPLTCFHPHCASDALRLTARRTLVSFLS